MPAMRVHSLVCSKETFEGGLYRVAAPGSGGAARQTRPTTKATTFSAGTGKVQPSARRPQGSPAVKQQSLALTARDPGPVPAKPLSLTEGLTDAVPTVEMTGSLWDAWGTINAHYQTSVFPGDLFSHRNTSFDQAVLTARFLYSQPALRQQQASTIRSLLEQAEQAAVQQRRVDQLQWLAYAYDQEFSDLPQAQYKVTTLQATANQMLGTGVFTLSPFRYPHVSYVAFPGQGVIPPFADPFGFPPPAASTGIPKDLYERNTKNSQYFWNVLGGR